MEIVYTTIVYTNGSKEAGVFMESNQNETKQDEINQDKINQEKKKREIIVIGAGMAGL